MRIVVFAILLFTASTVSPAVAKEVRAHRANNSAGAVSPKTGIGAAAGQGANTKDAAPADSRQSDTIEAPAAIGAPRADLTSGKGGETNTRLKIVTPGNFQARRMTVPASFSPVVRNAIGVPVTRHEVMTGNAGAHVGTAMPAGVKEIGSFAKPMGGLGGPAIGPPHPGPIASAGIANRGRIEGAGLIRPALAPASLGGPAKVAVGINGTTVRAKH